MGRTACYGGRPESPIRVYHAAVTGVTGTIHSLARTAEPGRIGGKVLV